MVLKVNPVAQSVTNIVQTYALVYGYSGGPWVNNVEVSHIDLSLIDPAAIMELQLGRIPVQSDPGTGSNSYYFDAVGNSIAGGNNSGFVSTSTTISDTLGQYYIQGGNYLYLNFSTSIESFKITQDYAFAYSVRLVGATSETADGSYHLNVWFSES